MLLNIHINQIELYDKHRPNKQIKNKYLNDFDQKYEIKLLLEIEASIETNYKTTKINLSKLYKSIKILNIE